MRRGRKTSRGHAGHDCSGREEEGEEEEEEEEAEKQSWPRGPRGPCANEAPITGRSERTIDRRGPLSARAAIGSASCLAARAPALRREAQGGSLRMEGVRDDDKGREDARWGSAPHGGATAAASLHLKYSARTPHAVSTRIPLTVSWTMFSTVDMWGVGDATSAFPESALRVASAMDELSTACPTHKTQPRQQPSSEESCPTSASMAATMSASPRSPNRRYSSRVSSPSSRYPCSEA
ncbi:unnamed protein product [Prorocentrum cordatum]|uniref:Protein phosphatase n=1 Tax=Prorocentrum cordatum TaxID=2364126 RepID=A0ABN9X7U0_9DINO|nr:unnamed protein product [Polarella glacialis]